MSESFERHFAKKEEKKSPEKIKEEKGLALAREIKEIEEKIKKEGETIEDYQRKIELLNKIEALYETKERGHESEVKTIVANLEKALEQGADKYYVAMGLVGVGTKESMELREKLLEQGKEYYVAYGLAGVGTEEAMELREKLLEQGADKNSVALSLAGVGTKEAMELREKLLEPGGADWNSVALSLAGVGTEEAMELRERLLKKGSSKDYIAWGLAGVGTKEAMELREKLLEQGAFKKFVAQGLAGVNTESAEEFRRKYFSDEPILIAKSYSTSWTIYDGVICRYGYEE